MTSPQKLDKDNIQDIIALAPLQEGILFHYLDNTDSQHYMEQLSLRISGIIDTAKLKRAWDYVAANNEMLRTIFRWDKLDKPIQIILKKSDIPFIEYDISNEEGSRKNQLLEDIKKRNTDNKLDISKEPIRLVVVKLEHSICELIIQYHHILYDGWSNGIIIKELLQAYDALLKGEFPAHVHKNGFKEFIKWCSMQDKKKQHEYWKNYLDGYEGEASLNIGGCTHTNKGINTLEHKLEDELYLQISNFCKEQRITLASLLNTAWGILLKKYKNTEDVIFGTTVSGRNAQVSGIENMVGLFINTLPLRISTSADKSLIEILKEVDIMLKERDSYQNTPLIDIKEYSKVSYGVELFETLLVVENYPLDKMLKEQHSIKIDSYEMLESTNYMLTLTLVNFEGLELKLSYESSILDNSSIERMLGHYINIIKSIIYSPHISLRELSILTQAEKEQIIKVFNDTYTEYPRDKTINELFEEQVLISPNKIAVEYQDYKLTYKELNEKSNQLARRLISVGVSKNQLVGIMVDKSPEMVSVILAILKAGGAYLPIDPEYPKERIQYMLSDSGARLLIAQADLLSGMTLDVEVLLLEHEYAYEDYSKGNLEAASKSTDLAYAIYTSGSTGNPKGTLIEHKSVVRLVKNTNYIAFKEDDKILQTGAVVFDAITFELWGALLNGLTLCLIHKDDIIHAEKLKQIIDNQAITTIWLTSSLFNQIVEQNPLVFEKCRNLLVGGDIVLPNYVNKVRGINKNLRIINGYGPTENTTFTACFNIDKDYKGSIPIGRPISNTRIYILDKYNNIQPVGIPGELCTCGEGLARGYINRPELTAERFVDNPLESNTKMYRTGDLARWLPDGNIEFLGRLDYQVKIRGFRIELGEIENRLLTHVSIKDAIVIVMDSDTGDKHLCCFYVSTENLTIKELRHYLLQALPDYMIPAYFINLDKFPLTNNGKVDRKVLINIWKDKVSMVKDIYSSEYEAPSTAMEDKLKGIWEQVLKINNIGVKDNFFELGGHSLKATTLAARIHKELDIEMPLKEIFRLPTIKEMAKYLNSTKSSTYSSIAKAEPERYYELSSAQRRIYALQQFDLNSIGYNMPILIELEGQPDNNRFETTFIQLIKRHEALRTYFELIGDEVVQIIQDNVDFQIEYMESITEKETEQLIHSFIRPFDLSKAPLVRAALIKLSYKEDMKDGKLLPNNQHCSEDMQNVSVLPNNQHCSRVVENRKILLKQQHMLLLDVHHIIADGTSMGILVDDFMKLYKGQELPRLSLQYKDYAVWQNKLNATALSELYSLQEQYWLKQFEAEVPILNLPIDYHRPAVQSFEGDSVQFELNEELTSGLKKISREQGSTLYMILLAAYNILLYKYTGQEDIVVGSPSAGRPHSDLESIIGMFVNTLAMRNKPTDNSTFIEFLEGVKDNSLKAFSNQDYPFDKLVQKLNIPRDTGRNPIFDVMFSMQNLDIQELNIDGLRVKSCEGIRNIAKFDLTLEALEHGSAIKLYMQYCTKLFSRDTIQRLCKHFSGIVKAIVHNPQIRLKDIQIITQEESQQLLIDFNNTQADYPKNKTLNELFEEQAERTPDNAAIIFDIKEITYKELDQKSNQIARVLRNRGVKPNQLVGIMAGKSIETLTGILGILKAGGAYVPIDPEYPRERIEFILQDSKLAILLAEHSQLGHTRFNGEILALDDEAIHNMDVSKLEAVNTPRDLAYVIYTSGSTGTPKGVLVEHMSVVNLIYYQIQNYSICEKDRVLQFSSLCFDASVEQIFITILMGAALILLSKEKLLDIESFEESLIKHKITHLNAVPAFLNNISWNSNYSLKRVVSGGDTCTPELAQRWSRNCDFYNVYGPTEATITSTALLIKAEGTKITLGKPVANTRIFILDRHNNIQPVGVAGELCVAGDGLARGYLDRPELTAQKFVHNPYESNTEAGKARLYKTGDMARWLPDGSIEFWGRIDNQVKIRGYRIELGEIESRLRKHPAVKEVLAVVNDNNGDKYICAYYVNKKAVEEEELKEYLSRQLPDYMIPSHFVELTDIPLNSNGKPDIKALPIPETVSDLRTQYEAPCSQLEQRLASLWQEVLKIDKIGINNNFFDLGGHSLKAAALSAKIHKELNVEVPLKEIFKAPTIKGLSQYIKSSSQSIYSSIQTAEIKEYYGLSSAQRRIYTLQQFDPQSTSYNMPVIIEIDGNLNTKLLEYAFAELVKRHEALRTSFKFINEEVVQIISDTADFQIEYMESLTHKETEQFVSSFIRPFELSKAPLVRAGLIKLPYQEAMENVSVLPKQQHCSEGMENGKHLSKQQHCSEDMENVNVLPKQQQSSEGMENRKILPKQQHCSEDMENRKILPKQQHMLLLDMHHIISDGTSMGIIVDEFISLYEGKELKSLAVQYKDYAEWQKELHKHESYSLQQDYWLKILSEDIPVLSLPTDYPRPAMQSFEGDFIDFCLNEELTRAVKKAADQTGSTLYMIILSAFNILLSKYCGQEDIIIGTPVAGRPHADLQHVIGMFINTLAMRNYPKAQKTIREFLYEVKENSLRAYENQDYQFEELVDKLPLNRDMSRNPLFDVMFVMQNAEIRQIEIPGLSFNKIKAKTNISKFDITLEAIEQDRSLNLSFQYCTKLYKRETIERMGEHFANILKDITADLDKRLYQVSMLTEAEKIKITRDFNNTEKDYPAHKTIQQLFAEQVKRTPDKTAVVYNTERLTYRELNEKSNQVARTLQNSGIKHEEMVAIMTDKSLEMVIGILAILKAGGAYIPIDPDYPKERILHMLEDSKAHILLTQASLSMEKIEGCKHSLCTILNLEDKGLYNEEAFDIELDNASSNNLAYVIYTSGSTGKPKGVMIEHKSVVRLVKNTNYIDLKEDDRILQTGAIVFDAITFELWGALLNGLSLFLAEKDKIINADKLKQEIVTNEITTIWLTSSLFNQIVDQNPTVFDTCRNLLVGGDVLSPRHINLIRKSNRSLRIINGYGPTENTTFTTCFTIANEYSSNIPIGSPIANTRVYVLDKHNNVMPIGVPGELCTSGDGLSRGYLNEAELTNEKFVSNPFEQNQRMYRTGDLVKWLPDGNIEFIGRLDHQVKLRGFRIELGEIEGKLLSHRSINEAVVKIISSNMGEKYLCAYYTCVNTSENQVSIKQLREYLFKELPEYMVPSFFIQLEKMPLTSNGKIDKKALAQPDFSTLSSEVYEAPSTELEKALVDIWQEVLKVDRIGINDNFFELGGHSLKATALAARIYKELNAEVPLKEIFKALTIKKLAEYIASAKRKAFTSIKVSEEKEHYEVSSAQNRLLIMNQIKEADTSYNMLQALEINGEIDKVKITDIFNQLIKRHEALRTSFEYINGVPIQRIHDNINFHINYMDAEGTDLNKQLKDFVRPFDLSSAPLIRLAFIRSDINKHIMLLDMHHIISDGYSIGIITEEFMKLYKGEGLPQIRVQYKDYAAWHNNLLQSEAVKQQEKYWMSKLEDFVYTELPKKSTIAVKESEGAVKELMLSSKLTSDIEAYCKKTNITRFAFMLGIFQLTLMKHTGQKDITIGIPNAGRNYEELEKIVGLFLNVLVLRTKIEAHATLKEYLNAISNSIIEARDNQEYPYENIYSKIKEIRDTDVSSIFSILFNYVPPQEEVFDLGNIQLKPYKLDSISPKYDVTLYIKEADEMQITVVYKSELYDGQYIEGVLNSYFMLIDKLLKDDCLIINNIEPAVEEKLKEETADIENWEEYFDNDDFF